MELLQYYMKKSIKKNLGLAVAASLVATTPTLSYTSESSGSLTLHQINLEENLDMLKGCSPEIIVEFEHGKQLYGRELLEKLLGEENTLRTGATTFTEEKLRKCLESNGRKINLQQPLMLSMSLCYNLPEGTTVTNTLMDGGYQLCLFYESWDEIS